MSQRLRFARPAYTRSKVMLEIAGLLAADNTHHRLHQARITLRAQGGGGPAVTLFGSDSYQAIEQVARGEVQLATINPGGPLGLALNGKGPFPEPIPLRAIAVIPSYDAFVFVVNERTGLRSLADIRDQRYPLKVSVRAQRDHANHFYTREILKAYGFSLDDVVAWGGEVRYDTDPPRGESANPRSTDETFRLDLARNGVVDAIFDEAVETWVPDAIRTGMRVLPLDEAIVQQLEADGFRRTVVSREWVPALPEDILTLDYSGWPIYTHADVADDLVTSFCAALDASKDQIPWQGEGPLPIERMVKDTPEGPMIVPLHPAAERYWRERGYLP
jgi:TRAP-type uncharacterized transport system substrate-binding protein